MLPPLNRNRGFALKFNDLILNLQRNVEGKSEKEGKISTNTFNEMSSITSILRRVKGKCEGEEHLIAALVA